MMWVLGVIIVLIIGGVAVVAAGHGDAMATEFDDRRDVTVPVGRLLVAEDLRRVRFTTVFRGYRASEVDALLARLGQQLDGVPPPPPPPTRVADVEADVDADENVRSEEG